MTIDSFLVLWIARHSNNGNKDCVIENDSKKQPENVQNDNEKQAFIISKETASIPKVVDRSDNGSQQMKREVHSNTVSEKKSKEEISNKERQRMDVMSATRNLKSGKFRKLKPRSHNTANFGMRKNKFWKLSLSERIQEQEETIGEKAKSNEDEHSYKQRILYSKDSKSTASFDNGLIKQSSTLTTANDDDDSQCYLSSFSASNDFANEDEYDTVYETGDLNNIFIQSDLDYHRPSTMRVYYDYTFANSNVTDGDD